MPVTTTTSDGAGQRQCEHEAREIERHCPGWGALYAPLEHIFMAWFPQEPGDGRAWDFDRDVQACLFAADMDALIDGIGRAQQRIAAHGRYGPHCGPDGYNAAWRDDPVCRAPGATVGGLSAP